MTIFCRCRSQLGPGHRAWMLVFLTWIVSLASLIFGTVYLIRITMSIKEGDNSLPPQGGSAGGAAGASHVDASSYRIPKLPGFFRSEPALWFSQAEMMFQYSHLTSEKARAGAVCSILDFDVTLTISDILQAEPPVEFPYSEIKKRLIANFEVSPETRLRQFLKGDIPGEGKPSLILSRMRNLSQGKCSDDVIRAVFLEQLPTACRAMLALSEVNDLQKLAQMADRFAEAASMGSSCASVNTPSTSLDELTNKVDALSNELQSWKRSSSNFSNQSTQRSRPRNFDKKKSTPQNKENRPDTCYFHRKFGNSAYKCTPWCKLNKNKNKQEN